MTYSMTVRRSGETVTISVSYGSDEDWILVFDAPGDSVLAEGAYSGATKYPSNSGDEPGLSISGNGRTSNTVAGSFVIKEMDVSGSGVNSFRATFEQRSDGSDAVLQGEVRYNAILPTPTPTPSATPAITPTPTPAITPSPTPIPEAGPVLTVTPVSSSVPASSGRAYLIVKNTGSGTMSYSSSISAGSDWLNISVGASGGNSGVIRLTFTANTGVARTGQITVMANGANGSPMVITITQAGRAGD